MGISSGSISVQYSFSVACSAICRMFGNTNGIISGFTHSFTKGGRILCRFTLCNNIQDDLLVSLLHHKCFWLWHFKHFFIQNSKLLYTLFLNFMFNVSFLQIYKLLSSNDLKPSIHGAEKVNYRERDRALKPLRQDDQTLCIYSESLFYNSFKNPNDLSHHDTTTSYLSIPSEILL